MSGPLSFIYRGQQLSAAQLAALQKPIVKAPRAETEPKWFGFIVVGFSPEQMAEGRLNHVATTPWDSDEFMRTHQPRRVRSKPYETHGGAVACAELAEKSGWLRVAIKEAVRR